MFLLGVISIILLGYIAVCEAVIFDKMKEIQTDVACLLKCKASDVAERLRKEGYIATRKARNEMKV